MSIKKQSGFTMIELVMVIMILGILAAFAIEKYSSLDKESRQTIVKELYGSIVSAAEMVRSLALARGHTTTASNVNLGDDLIVSINNKSYPIADNTYGIGKAVVSTTGFTVTSITDGIRYDLISGNPSCSVSYVITTNSQPSTTYNVDGC